MIGNFFKLMISLKMMMEILCDNFEKCFSQMGKNGFKKDLVALPPDKFFHVCIINRSNHTVCLLQFGIDLHL